MQETEKVARKYGREKIEDIIRILEKRGLNERDLKNTAPYLQFKQLLVYLNSQPDNREDYQI